jgi:hypothetical protein
MTIDSQVQRLRTKRKSLGVILVTHTTTQATHQGGAAARSVQDRIESTGCEPPTPADEYGHRRGLFAGRPFGFGRKLALAHGVPYLVRGGWE